MVRLYDAQVMHARLWPKRHGFTHRVFCFAVELSAFGRIGEGLTLLGEKGWAPYQLHAADFLPAAAVVGATRPTDVGKPFQMLVANPFRYTFIDPLGQH